MSKEDPREHLKTYERFCAPRFEKIEDDLDAINTKVDNIDKVIHDGLKDKVTELQKYSRLLLRILIALLLSIIATATTLYLSNMFRYDEIESQLLKISHEVSN